MWFQGSFIRNSVIFTELKKIVTSTTTAAHRTIPRIFFAEYLSKLLNNHNFAYDFSEKS